MKPILALYGETYVWYSSLEELTTSINVDYDLTDRRQAQDVGFIEVYDMSNATKYELSTEIVTKVCAVEASDE